MLLEGRAAPRCTKLALCLEPYREQSRPFPWKADVPPPPPPPTSRPCRSARKAGFSSGGAPKPTLNGGEVRSGSGHGVNKNGTRRGSHRRRIRTATGRPCPRAAHSTHPQRVPWNCHCGARDESEGGLHGSSQGILEPATTPVPPLWTLPNRMKGHRDDRRIPRRGQNRRIGTSACYAVPYLRNTRICTTATIRPEVRPCSGCPVPTLNLTSIGRRSLNCLHLAHGSGRIGDCEEAVDDAHWRGNVLSQEREPLRRRRQLGKADSCRDEACF